MLTGLAFSWVDFHLHGNWVGFSISTLNCFYWHLPKVSLSRWRLSNLRSHWAKEPSLLMWLGWSLKNVITHSSLIWFDRAWHRSKLKRESVTYKHLFKWHFTYVRRTPTAMKSYYSLSGIPNAYTDVCLSSSWKNIYTLAIPPIKGIGNNTPCVITFCGAMMQLSLWNPGRRIWNPDL